MTRLILDLDSATMDALSAPWPDLSELEDDPEWQAECAAAEHAPINPRGAPDLDFRQLTKSDRTSQWGEPTASHITALERAVQRANALVWPLFCTRAQAAP